MVIDSVNVCCFVSDSQATNDFRVLHLALSDHDRNSRWRLDLYTLEDGDTGIARFDLSAVPMLRRVGDEAATWPPRRRTAQRRSGWGAVMAGARNIAAVASGSGPFALEDLALHDEAEVGDGGGADEPDPIDDALVAVDLARAEHIRNGFQGFIMCVVFGDCYRSTELFVWWVWFVPRRVWHLSVWVSTQLFGGP